MYIIILITLILSMIFFDYIKKLNEKKIIIAIFFGGLAIISGIRYNVGIDYMSYFNLFQINPYKNNLLEAFPEYIYWGINSIIKEIGGEFYWVTLIMASITNYFVYKGIKIRKLELNYILLSILIFISGFWLSSFNIMRQCVSVAIFFYASIFIKEKRLIKYIIYIILATGFHKSSLLLIPLYFISSVNINIQTYILLIITAYGIVIGNFSQKILSYLANYLPGYQSYMYSKNIFTDDVNIFAFGVLANIIISLFILVFTEKKIDNNFKIEKNYYMYGCIINILSISTFMYDRIGIYFRIFEILIIPLGISLVKNKKDKQIIALIIISCFVILYIKSTLGANPSTLITYRTFWNNSF